MDGFASKVDSSLSGSGASTGSKFGKAFCGAAGKTAGSGFVAKLTGSLSGAAGAFSRSGRASGAAFSGGVLGKAAAFSGGLLCAVGDGLSSVNSVFGSTGTTAGGNMASKVASGFSANAAVITGVVAGVVQRVVSTVSSSVDAAVARVDTLNNFPKVLQSLGYGADESQRSVDTLSDRLSELPTRLDAAATGVQQLAPSSKSIDQATDRYLAFNDAVLAGGASEDIQSNAMTQLTKAVSTNKMEMDTWMSIQQAMPGQLDQVAKSMLGQSASASDLYQGMKDGKVSVSDFADAVVDLDKNGADGITSFSEQAKAATGGIKTSFSNMCNAFPKGVAKIIGAIGSSNIVGVIDGVKGAVNGAFGAVTDAMADPSIRDAASSFAAVFSGVVAGGVSVAGDAFAGAVEMTSAFCETLLNNEAASSFAGTLDALGYTASSMGDAIWSTVSQITGWSSPAEGAADAANALDDAFEAAEPVIRSVGDAFQWVSEHSEEVAPVVKGVGGAFLVMKVAGGPVGSLLKVIGGALLSLGVSAPAAGAGLATTAAGETAAGTAAGAAAGKMTSFGAAVLMVGAGVLLACGGIGLLALSAIKLGEAGPQAAIGMAAMVAVIAGLALGAAALGPALTAGSVGMVAFGAAVALAGVGILLAATGLAIMSLALPTIAACGPEAAVGMAALGASLFVLAPGALTASGGLLALAAGAAACAVASAALGMAAIVAGVGLIVMGAGGLLAGAGLSTCSRSPCRSRSPPRPWAPPPWSAAPASSCSAWGRLSRGPDSRFSPSAPRLRRLRPPPSLLEWLRSTSPWRAQPLPFRPRLTGSEPWGRRFPRYPPAPPVPQPALVRLPLRRRPPLSPLPPRRRLWRLSPPPAGRLRRRPCCFPSPWQQWPPWSRRAWRRRRRPQSRSASVRAHPSTASRLPPGMRQTPPAPQSWGPAGRCRPRSDRCGSRFRASTWDRCRTSR